MAGREHKAAIMGGGRVPWDQVTKVGQLGFSGVRLFRFDLIRELIN